MSFRDFYHECKNMWCYEGAMLAFKDSPSRNMAELWDKWVYANHQHIWWIVWNTSWIREGVIAKIWLLYGDGSVMTKEKIDNVLTNFTIENKIEILGGTPNPFRS